MDGGRVGRTGSNTRQGDAFAEGPSVDKPMTARTRHAMVFLVGARPAPESEDRGARTLRGSPGGIGRTEWRRVVTVQGGAFTSIKSRAGARVRTPNASKVGLVAVVAGVVLALSVGATLPHAVIQAPAAYAPGAHNLAPMTSAMEQALESGAQRSMPTGASPQAGGTVIVSRADGLTARVPSFDAGFEAAIAPSTTSVVTRADGLTARVPAFDATSATSLLAAAAQGSAGIVVTDSGGRDRLVPRP